MTSAEFRREVDAELEQLRRAHVVAGVEVGTDMLVGVSLSLDGRPYDLTSHVTSADQRQLAFEETLRSLRHFRGRHTPPALAPAPRRRMRIPVERHIGEPSWPALVLLFVFVTMATALWWIIDDRSSPAGKSSGLQRRARVGARTTAGNLTAKCGGPVGDDPAECVSEGDVGPSEPAPGRLGGRLL